MTAEAVKETRREFLKMSGQALTGVVVAGSVAVARPAMVSAQFASVKEPAVVGYPNTKGITIERVTYPARNMGTTIVVPIFLAG